MSFGVFVFPDVEELDFVGPWEMLGMWRRVSEAAPAGVIVAENGGAVTCAKGLSVNAHASFADCPPLDYLLVPGGQGTRREVDNTACIGFIRRQAARCKAVMSVCTGSFLLERAGLLEGKKATTHWGELPKLRKLPGLDVTEERFVRTGNVWVAAGVSAGIDMMLAFIASEAGDEVAGKVQFFSEYYPSPTRYGRAHESELAPAYLR